MSNLLATTITFFCALGLFATATAQSSITIENCGVSYIDPQDVIEKDAPSYDTVVYRTQFEDAGQQRAYYVDVNAFGGRQVDRTIVYALLPDGERRPAGEIAFGNCADCVDGFAFVYNDSVWVENVSDRQTMELWLQSFNQPPFSLTSNLQTLSGVGRVSGVLPLCATGIEVVFIIYSDPASTTTEFAAQVVCPEIVRDCAIDLSVETDCQRDSMHLQASLPAACFSSNAKVAWRNRAGFRAEGPSATLPLTGHEGMYYFTVEDGDCVLEDSVLVENPQFADAGPDIAACAGEEVLLEGTGGIRYFWEYADGQRMEDGQWLLPTVQLEQAGVYVLHAFNEAGCADTDTLFLTVQAPPAPEVTVSSACLGDTVFFSLLNDTAFAELYWFDAGYAPLLLPLKPSLQLTDFGEYTVEAVDAFGCRVETRFQVAGSTPPDFQYVIEDNCDSARVTLSPVSYQYTWDNGLVGPVLATRTGGVFGLTVTDSLGCQTREVIDVPPPDGPDVAILTEDPRCPNEFGAIELAPENPELPAIFSIDGGETYTLSNRFEGLPPGQYTVTIQDDLGCIQNIPVELVAPDTLGVDIGLESLEVRPGTVVQLQAQTVGTVVRYQWLPKEIDTGAPQTEFPAETNLDIRLIVEDERGCLMSDGFPLTIVLGDIYAPNAFSPDGDGRNDTFMLYSDNGSGEVIEYLRLFDRYGGLLYEAKDILPNDEPSGWDGSFRGQPLNTGVYVYQAVVRFGNGMRKEYAGEVVLVR